MHEKYLPAPRKSLVLTVLVPSLQNVQKFPNYFTEEQTKTTIPNNSYSAQTQRGNHPNEVQQFQKSSTQTGSFQLISTLQRSKERTKWDIHKVASNLLNMKLCHTTFLLKTIQWLGVAFLINSRLLFVVYWPSFICFMSGFSNSPYSTLYFAQNTPATRHFLECSSMCWETIFNRSHNPTTSGSRHCLCSELSICSRLFYFSFF